MYVYNTYNYGVPNESINLNINTQFHTIMKPNLNFNNQMNQRVKRVILIAELYVLYTESSLMVVFIGKKSYFVLYSKCLYNTNMIHIIKSKYIVNMLNTLIYVDYQDYST